MVRLAIAILVVSVGCGSQAIPTATPDVPLFSEGEATGLAKQYLATTLYSVDGSCLRVVTRQNGYFLEEYEGHGVWLVSYEAVQRTVRLPQERTPLPGTDTGELEIIKLLRDAVSSNPEDIKPVTKVIYSWRVYERSLAVNAQGPTISGILC